MLHENRSTNRVLDNLSRFCRCPRGPRLGCNCRGIARKGVRLGLRYHFRREKDSSHLAGGCRNSLDIRIRRTRTRMGNSNPTQELSPPFRPSHSWNTGVSIFLLETRHTVAPNSNSENATTVAGGVTGAVGLVAGGVENVQNGSMGFWVGKNLQRPSGRTGRGRAGRAGRGSG